MNLVCTTFPVRHLGATAFCVLVAGTGVGTALADPPAQTHNYSPRSPWERAPTTVAGSTGRAKCPLCRHV